MWRFLNWLLILAVALAAAAAVIVYSGGAARIAYWLYAPSHGFDLSKKAPEPDYAEAKNWAALPGDGGLAYRAPAGENVADLGVDVFFVHPTGYLHGGDWNSPMDPDSKTEENTKWMMANQASAYSSCCRIFAPRYREATIWRYIGAPEDIATKTMDFAYADVVRAFENFLATRNDNRPFILAGHSQGTTHAFRLLAEKIDTTPLRDRMVAAYLIGSRITNAEAAQLKTVPVCEAAHQTGCLIHYAAFGPGAAPGPDYDDLVCVNPLSWRRDGARTPKEEHIGGVASSGRFQIAWGDDKATGLAFEPLGPSLPKLTGAACEKGLLMVDDLRDSAFKNLILQQWNYHGLDYPLFHMDLRRNLQTRIDAYKRDSAQ